MSFPSEQAPAQPLELSGYLGIKVRRGPLGQQDRHVVHEVVAHDGYRTAIRGTRGAGEVVVDIGAHIGTFACLWRHKNPQARFACVEVCPENIPVLNANVGEFAEIAQAACTYEPGEFALLNSVKDDGTATGGSTVVPVDAMQDAETYGHLYWPDRRRITKVTLENVMDRLGVDHIDVLKLDCEGSEYSILANGPMDRVGFVCGEYHGGDERWESFRKEHFADWGYSIHHRAGGLGIFHLQRPGYSAS